MDTIKLKYIQDLGFGDAYSLAREESKKYVCDPMLLSWLNRRTKRYSPDLNYCQTEGRESWETYGEYRGGTLRIEVGDKYAFIFREGSE